MPCARRKRSSVSGPPWRGGGSPRTGAGSASRGARRVVRTESTGPNVVCPAMADGTMAERLVGGDRRALARAITLVESDDPAGWELVRDIYPRTGNAAIVGLTGAPGSGESTLIGALTKLRREVDRQVAVLSIDPSSPFTQGALLGDR